MTRRFVLSRKCDTPHPSTGPSVATFPDAPRWEGGLDENKQLVHRHPLGFVRRVLDDFNAGSLNAATAAPHLGVSRSRLYEPV